MIKRGAVGGGVAGEGPGGEDGGCGMGRVGHWDQDTRGVGRDVCGSAHEELVSRARARGRSRLAVGCCCGLNGVTVRCMTKVFAC